MDENKRKEALAAAILQIEKNFGKGAVINMGSREKVAVDVISTGCLAIDKALGIGGVPRGRVVEIYGPESSGKTTLALHIIAEAQKAGGLVGFIDAEHALDPNYAATLGVELDKLYVSQPDNGEQALEIADELIRSGTMDVIVVDSVAALTPKAEIDGEMGDSHMGLQARLMSQALRKLTGSISKTNTCLIFINQLRDKLGIMFGSPETTTGGKALKFYASIRIDVRKRDALKDGGDNIGNKTKVKIVKNKLSAPFREAEFDIIYGAGISNFGCILDMSVEEGLVSKSGSWYQHEGEKIGQGRDRAIQYLKNNPNITQELEKQLRSTF